MIKKKAVIVKPKTFKKEFVCQRNADHIEPWRGEPDGRPLPDRLCNECNGPMSLVIKKFDKVQNRYVPYLRPRTEKKQGEKKVSIPTLSKFVKCMGDRYRVRLAETERTGWVVRHAEKPTLVKGLKTTYLERSVYISISSKGTQVSLCGVIGWIEDIKTAARKLHTPVVYTKFLGLHRYKRPTKSGGRK